MNKTVEEIEEEIERLSVLHMKWIESDKLYGGTSFDKGLTSCRALLTFQKLEADYECTGFGSFAEFKVGYQILIYALSTGRWRQKGKGTWYRSKDPENFYRKYVLKEDV